MDDLSDEDILQRARQMVPEHLHRSGRILRRYGDGQPHTGAGPRVAPSTRAAAPAGLFEPPTGDGLPQEPAADAHHAEPTADGASTALELPGSEAELVGLAALVGATLPPPAPGAVSVEFSQATATGVQSVVVQLVDGQPVRVLQLGG